MWQVPWTLSTPSCSYVYVRTCVYVHIHPEFIKFIICLHEVHNLHTMYGDNIMGLGGMRFEGMIKASTAKVVTCGNQRTVDY